MHTFARSSATLLMILSMIGMMVVFMRESGSTPALVWILISLAILTFLGVLGHLLMSKTLSTRHSWPRWSLPLAGVIGGLVMCAQLAVYLANSLQETPVGWYFHVPAGTALLGLAAFILLARQP